MYLHKRRLAVLGAAIIAAHSTKFLNPVAGGVVANPSFEQGQLGEMPERWIVPKAIKGYRIVITDQQPFDGNQCAVVERGEIDAAPFGNLMQRIDATPFRGQRIRYRAAVRAEVAQQRGSAHLWLRVDRPREQGQPVVGFFDNMFNRPIVEPDWTYFEIVGDIADDAEFINIGMYFKGRGRAWLDDISLETVEGDPEVTGRDLGKRGMSLDAIGAGLLEISGAMELKCGPTLISQVAATFGIGSDSTKRQQDKSVEIMLPLPLAHRDQVPLTYELTVTPPEAASSVEVFQDTPHNFVARVAVTLGDAYDKVDVAFNSVVLVGPSDFSGVPDQAAFVDDWPEECQPWLQSTWCVGAEDERIVALSEEIAAESSDVLTYIAGVKERAGQVFYNAQGFAKDLTAAEALDGRGSCTSCANLVAALLRAGNVPARILSGYPSWSGPLQTHYIVEAYVPNYGWYPIESTMCKSPWPNAYQVNVAIIPPQYEEMAFAGWRRDAAGGVPYLSLTELPKIPSGISVNGTIDPDRSCDHQCKMIRKLEADEEQWDSALETARERWSQWLAAVGPSDGDALLVFGPAADQLNATSPAELLSDLAHSTGAATATSK